MAFLRTAVTVLLIAGVCYGQTVAATVKPAATTAAAVKPASAIPAPAATTAAAPGTALKALQGDKNLSIFTRATEIAGLHPFLDSPVTRATIFAPSDAAFKALLAALKIDAAALDSEDSHLLVDRLVGYHIVTSGDIKAKAITDGAKLTTANKGTLTLGVTPAAGTKAAAVTIKGAQNSATVEKADIVVGNVTIHVIDTVLLPSTVFATIADALKFSATTSTLAGLIAKDATLAKAAADPTTNITLFAPTDAAFATVLATPAGKAIAADPKALSKVLAYHAVKGAKIYPSFMGKGSETATTLAGQPVTISKVVTPKADGNVGAVTVTADSAGAKPATIKKHNIIAGASMIDVIDGVLIPKSA